MAEVTYGQSDDPGLPPVALPSMGDSAPPQGPLKITINKAPTPPAAPTQSGSPWAPFTPPAPPSSDDTSAAPGTDMPAPSKAGPWGQFTPPPPKAPPRQQGGEEAAVRGVANAITFGFAPAIAGLAEASGIPSAAKNDDEIDVNPLRPIMGAAKLLHQWLGDHPDPSVVAAYERGRDGAEKAQKDAGNQHPHAYLVGQLIGGLAVPFGGAASEGALAARLGRSMLGGATAGGLYGAGDTISEGDVNPVHVAKNAAGYAAAGAGLGLAGGGLAEGVAGTIGKTKSIVRAAKDTDKEASTVVTHALEADMPQLSKTVGDTKALTAGHEAGTPMSIVDFGGENARALMRSAANRSPTARNIIQEGLDTRFQQQADRFSGWVRSKFGGHDKDLDIEKIERAARKANSPNYKVAYAAGSKGVWSPRLEELTSAPAVQAALKGAHERGRNRAVADGFAGYAEKIKTNPDGSVTLGNGNIPTMQFWDYTQRELRDQAAKAFKSGANEEGNAIKALHHELLDELDHAVPAFAKARGTAAAFFKAGNAVDAGARFVTDNTIHNAKAARVIAGMSAPERALFSRGFAAELANQIERRGYSTDVLKNMFIASPRAKQRIMIALGRDGADEFEALMRVEGIVDKARKALGNSTTIRQGHEFGLAAGGVGVLEGLHGAINPAYIIAGAIVLGGRQAAKQIDERLAVKIAEMLMSDNPAVLAKGLKAAARNNTVREALRRASDTSMRQILNHLGASGVAAAALTGAKDIRNAFGGEKEQHHQQDDQYYPAEPAHGGGPGGP